MSAEIYKKIGRNSFYNVIRRVVLLPLNLVLVAVTLRYVGLESYGVWVFIQMVMTFATLMDFGISSGITKYTAEYEASGEHARILRVFNTFFVVYLLLGVVFFIAVLFCRDWIITAFLKTGQLPRGEIGFLLPASAVVFAVNMAFSVYPSFLNGLQRMDLTNKAAVVWGSANFVFSIGFLVLGWKIRGLVAANAAASVITLFVHIYYAGRAAPYLKLNPLLFDFSTLLHVFKFSSFGALGGILSMVHFQMDKLIVNYFLGVGFLAYYDVAQKVVFLVWGLCGAFTMAVMPAASSAYANMGLPKVREIFQTTFKYLALVAVPVFLFLSIMADRLIFFWLGNGYETSALLLQFLALAYLLNVLTGPGAAVLTGMGLPRIPFIGGLLTAIVSAAVSITLISKIGLAAVIISPMAAYTVCAVYAFVMLRKVGQISLLAVFDDCLKLPLVASLAIAFCVTVARLFVSDGIVAFSLTAFVYFAAYTAIICRNGRYKFIKELICSPSVSFTRAYQIVLKG